MKLSLAGWSVQKLFRAAENPLSLVEFPRFAREQFGIEAVELNNIFFTSRDAAYLGQLASAAQDAGVKLLNIAVDEKGDLSSSFDAERQQAIENYARWISVAAEIGCGAIRANSGGKNAADRQQAIRQCTESFQRLCDVGRRHGIVVVMENHGGLSANADAIVQVMEAVRRTHGADAIGTLPDYGNWPAEVDRYSSLRKILPYAKAVHAKVLDIDEDLNHPAFDFARCVELTRASGYDGYLGIEFEGSEDPLVGVKRSVELLSRLIRESAIPQ